MAKRLYSLNPLIDDIYKSTLYQPQQQNHFELQITLPTDVNGGTNSVARSNAMKYLNLAVSEFSLPTIATSPVEIPFGNTKINLAGKTEFSGSNSITCIDYIGADIERILYNWQCLVTNPETGQQGWAATYKTDAVVIEYAPDGTCLSSWVLRGLWPSEINYGSLSKSSGDLKQIEVQLSYDLAYKRYDADLGRSDAGLLESDAKNPANTSRSNMSWKAPQNYAPENVGGPLGAASVDDGYGTS